MTHTNWRYRGRRTPAQRAEFRAAQRRRIELRWHRYHAHAVGEPTRKTRVIELTIRDSHRPMRVLRFAAQPHKHSWSRWRVTENGAPVGSRPFGRTRIAKLIAMSLE